VRPPPGQICDNRRAVAPDGPGSGNFPSHTGPRNLCAFSSPVDKIRFRFYPFN